MRTAEINTAATPSFELKGSALTLMILHLWVADSDCLIRQLQDKFGQVPGFFKNVPLVIDLGSLQDPEQVPDFKLLVQTLRPLGLVPVGVRGGNAVQNEYALAANLGVLHVGRGERATEPAAAPKVEPEPAEQPLPSELPAAMAGAKVITHPVRSGQRVVAPHGDLIVLASVNAGAEILAAGNIHVYGALRGRALAGVKGDTEARIFSLQFNPELIAIAGEYMVNEELDGVHLGQSTVISLADNRLLIEPFGSFISLA